MHNFVKVRETEKQYFPPNNAYMIVPWQFGQTKALLLNLLLGCLIWLVWCQCA